MRHRAIRRSWQRETHRVKLIETDSAWTEIERDAVAAIERFIWTRGFHRSADIVEVPLTLSYLSKMLVSVEARRSGRDYARDVLEVAVSLGLVRDTGRVMKPCRPPKFGTPWWRVFEIVPLRRVLTSLREPQYGDGTPSRDGLLPSTAYLRRFLESKGLIHTNADANPRSPRAAFAALGPP